MSPGSKYCPDSHSYSIISNRLLSNQQHSHYLLPKPKMDSIMDSTSSPQFYQCKYGRVRLLAVDNYPDWSTTLTNFLKADRTWKIVQGIETLPTQPAAQSGLSLRVRSRQEPQNEAENVVAQATYEEKQDDYKSRAAKACSIILSLVSSSF
jgi:hypothetical protein